MCRESPKLAACYQSAKELGLDLRGVELVPIRFADAAYLGASAGHHRLNEMHRWCMREDRPGFFCVTYPNVRNVHAFFYFSDPNVAFEFRMKWC